MATFVKNIIYIYVDTCTMYTVCIVYMCLYTHQVNGIYGTAAAAAENANASTEKFLLLSVIFFFCLAELIHIPTHTSRHAIFCSFTLNCVNFIPITIATTTTANHFNCHENAIHTNTRRYIPQTN